jgi:tRNA-2-methylthio-N6-dimethylallyladenosine synthase
MPYLHLPVQSGSDRILAAMNRRHTAPTTGRIVERLRAARPDLALSSDFIVGFPGETDGDFARRPGGSSLEVGYAQAYSFKYSPRPGTPAASRAQVPEAVKAERLAGAAGSCSTPSRQAFNAACVGRVLPVLLERPGRRPGQLVGRSPYMQAVHVDLPAAALARLAGRIVEVRIEAAHANSLAGRLPLGDAPHKACSGASPARITA